MSTERALSARERARLRGLAHGLKPVMQVGREGVDDASVAALREAFNTRELLKIRVLPAAPEDVRETAEVLAKEVDGAVVVQTVGRVAVLFCPRPEELGG